MSETAFFSPDVDVRIAFERDGTADWTALTLSRFGAAMRFERIRE